jgi:hypothetical protein
MTQDTVKALSDAELVQVIDWAQGEQKARAERRKRETVAKIKEMAVSVGIGVAIQGTRGRPRRIVNKARGTRIFNSADSH